VPELEANSYADDELRLFNCKPLVWRKVAMANWDIQLGGGMIGINRQRSVRNLIVSSASKCKSCTIKAEASIGDFICDEFNPRVLNTVKGRGATPIIEIENYPRNRRSSRFSKWITVRVDNENRLLALHKGKGVSLHRTRGSGGFTSLVVHSEESDNSDCIQGPIR